MADEKVPGEPWLQITCSPDFVGWLLRERVGFAFTTYQSHKLLLLGAGPDGRPAVCERTFRNSMGLWADGQTLWLATRYQIWRFANALAPDQLHEGRDRLFVPRTAHTTGDLDVHDLAPEDSGRLVFVNTKFNCLATVDERASFRPLWKPPFISALVPEDRCHLNGLALDAGRARYVTAVATSDVADGWRDRRADGGVVVDVRSNEVVLSGLSMPHSPRVHNGALWLHNSGTGFLGRADLAAGRFEPVAFCPGYLRGLTFVGDFAVVGLSKPRRDNSFGGLALDGALAARGAEPRCGLNVIDLRTGVTAHWVRLDGPVTELYDVVALPGVTRPWALGLKSDEIERLLTFGESDTL
ncbi:TIGR03032 family protein [Gemmata sp. G18]|uniref:TIGR03032 family protein n=1 Tax=Gemmata palustris TaxID=2822762 RepID=A0ABS5BMY8_9BACT|nr:TIGR03032 family protein [Gemmata palustris]MBP3955098.1 TIGR03032 family protein [Gemmata palustris]